MHVGYIEIAILNQYLASLRAVNAATGHVLSIRRRQTTMGVSLNIMSTVPDV